MPEELQEQYEQLSSEEQDQLKGAVHGLPWAEGKLEHNTRNSLLLFDFQIFPEQDILHGTRQSMTISEYLRHGKRVCYILVPSHWVYDKFKVSVSIYYWQV